MPLPVNATIQAAESFVRNVGSAREFLQQQDAASADVRYAALLGQLKEARALLRWNPACGRPARFLGAQSAQAQSMAFRAKALSAAHGVPDLRELLVRPYILLYAHCADRVVLPALKHERQLTFRIP